MSLAKIPCILAFTAALHPICDAKGKSPPDSQVRLTNEKPDVSTKYVNIIAANFSLLKAIHWIISGIEIAAIIATKVPNPPPIFGYDVAALLRADSRSNLYLTPLSTVGMVLVVAGGLWRIWCFRTMGRLFTAAVVVQEGHKLVKTGPYGFVRHPSYTGLFAACLGMTFWYGSRGSWLRESGILGTAAGKCFICLLTAVYGVGLVMLPKRMMVEDALLKKSFEKEWEDWARQVPYSVIPGIY